MEDICSKPRWRAPGGPTRCSPKTAACSPIESKPGEFYVIGGGLTVRISRDPDTDRAVAGIASIEQLRREGGDWTVVTRVNGDQSNQGRQLSMDPREIRVWRVRLYSIPE